MKERKLSTFQHFIDFLSINLETGEEECLKWSIINEAELSIFKIFSKAITLIILYFVKYLTTARYIHYYIDSVCIWTRGRMVNGKRYKTCYSFWT